MKSEHSYPKYGKSGDNLFRVKTQESADSWKLRTYKFSFKYKGTGKKGVGAIVIKSLFEEQIHIEAEKVIKNETDGVSTFSHAPDTIFSKRIYDYDEAYSYIYDFAKRNTLGKYLYFLNEAKESVDIPVIASINCVSNQDWHSFAKKIEETGVDALNSTFIFFPPTGAEVVRTMRRFILI